jgi:hypothetical protein
MTNIEYLRDAIAQGFLDSESVREHLALSESSDVILPIARMIKAEPDLSIDEVVKLTKLIANLAVYVASFAIIESASDPLSEARFNAMENIGFDVR